MVKQLIVLTGIFYLEDDDSWQDFLDGKPPHDNNAELFKIQRILSKGGIFRMCTHGVAHGDPQIALEAWLLLSTGFHNGPTEVQDDMLAYLANPQNQSFFVSLQIHLRRAAADILERKK